MGKVEEVARALYAATPFKTAGSYDSQSEVYKRMCRVLARAAIEAMRVPTRSMVKAGHIPTWQIPLGNGTFATGLGLGADQSRIFNAMIDAALSEDKEQG